MTVILEGSQPPLLEVSKLGGSASQIYCLLWTSAYKDVRKDPDKRKPWKERSDFGGTTSWSHKGIADYLGISRTTVIKACNTLLDNGFVAVVGWKESTEGSKHRIYRVFHGLEVEAQQHVISLFNEPPSERWKKIEAVPSNDPEEDLPEEYSWLPPVQKLNTSSIVPGPAVGTRRKQDTITTH